jgi:hypothetical protein
MRMALRIDLPRTLATATLSALVGISFFACGHDSSDARVSLAPALVFPRGLLDGIQKLTVVVYDVAGGIDCDDAAVGGSGKASGTTASTPKVSQTDLKQTGCTPPARFCGDLPISRSPTPRVFVATAFGGNGVEAASGCTKIVVDQERLPLTIKMVRSFPPATCGNGVVEPTEQCDPAGASGDSVCDATCQTKEEWLSHGSGGAGETSDGLTGEKVSPSFAWPSQNGSAGRFLAAFGDKSPKPQTQVTLRVLGDTLATDGTLGPGVSTFSFFAPYAGDSFPPQREGNDQLAPAATVVGNKYYVVFQDDSSGTLDIHLRTMDVANPSVGDQPQNQPLCINGSNPAACTNEAGVQSQPAIAPGPNGVVFIAWQDGATTGPGAIKGRTFNLANNVYGNTVELSAGTSNQRVELAGTPSGWAAVWQSGSDVKMRAIAADGTPAGSETTVNDGSHHGVQDHPSIASIDGGRVAVAWADRGATGGSDVFVQRFGTDGTAIAGDQTARVNDVVGDGEQNTPAIAGSTAAGGMFSVVWIDESSNHVRARLLGGSGGFLFNNVDGQAREFQASLTDRHVRGNPAVVIGGSGPFLAIGWEDRDASKPGIYVRRFPTPTQ